MAVMFSGVPDNYDSVFGPLVYTLTGIASGETVDAEVFTVGAETPVGVKRIAGSDAALVNIACYMRRLLTPVPFPADSTGLFSDAGRFVTAAVGCGGAVSPVRTFTGAVRRLSEYEVLTTLPMHRTIAWDESDEVSLLVPGCSMTYSWRVSGEAEYVYESPEYIASRGIVTLVVGMPSVRTTLAAVGVQTDGVAALRVTVRVAGESVAEVHYRIEPREPGSVRLCWFNRMGGLDYHTFGRPDTGYLEASREAFLNHDGYAAASVRLADRTELSSGYLPRLWMEGLALIPASPRVWRVEEELCGVVVLDDLILHHAHAGFFHRHLRQRDAHVVRGEGSCLENLVHLLLRVGRIDLLCRADAGEGRLEALHAIDDRILFRHDTLSLCFIRPAGMRPRTGNVGVCRGDENSVADC